jgi:hypothetical protein
LLCFKIKGIVMSRRHPLPRLISVSVALFAAIALVLCVAAGVRAQTYNSDLYEVLAGHENLTDILTNQPRQEKYYSGWPPRLVATRPVGGQQALRYDNFNLLVTIPEGHWYDPNHWYDLNPKRDKPNVDFLIGRRNPTMIVALTGESVGVESNETNESLLAWSEARMKRTRGSVVLPNERVVDANGFFGIAYEVTAPDDGSLAHYSNWVAARNGYNYCLCVSGRQKDAAAVNEAMISVVRGIRQIDPDKVAHRAGYKPTAVEPSVATSDSLDVPQIKFSR